MFSQSGVWTPEDEDRPGVLKVNIEDENVILKMWNKKLNLADQTFSDN